MKKTILKVIALMCALICAFSLFACDKEEEPPTPLTEDEIAAAYFNESFATTVSTVQSLKQKTGGFLKGVCHPNEDYVQIKAANIEWVRFDLTSLPYDSEGNLTQGYLNFKARAKGYADQGIKVMAITPYPSKYIEAGLDPREESSQLEIMKMAKFLAEDLQGIVSAFQITNEMGIAHFTLPLTVKEAADFIGIQLKAMYRVRGDIIIGYNLGGIEGFGALNPYMTPYLNYVDYVGADIYLGCFENIMTELNYFKFLLDLAYNPTGKPIILTEFGYIGAGQQLTDEEKLELLQGYGAQGNTIDEAEAYVKANAGEIIYSDAFPEDFREHLELIYEIDEANMTIAELDAAFAEMGDDLFNTELVSHLYCELADGYQMNDYEHTREGQASFFTDAFEYMSSLSYLCGTFVYCYSDSDACYICGQADCPVETGWGLVDCDGVPKLSYYSVKTAYAELE